MLTALLEKENIKVCFSVYLPVDLSFLPSVPSTEESEGSV